MAHLYIELVGKSRELNVSKTGMNQDITVRFILDPTVTSTIVDFLGDNRDSIALEYAYTIFPDTKELPVSGGGAQILVIDQIKLTEIRDWEYEATATYKYNLNSGTGGDRGGSGGGPAPEVLPFYRFEFNIGGGTRIIKKAVDVRNAFYNEDHPIGPITPFTPPGNLIGLTEDGVEGAAVPTGELVLQITGYYYPTTVDLDFVNTVAEVLRGTYNTGSYNDDTFLGFDAGEVQLRNVSGGGTVVDIIPITFDFSIKKNITDEPDEGFTNLTALGHDIIDYRFRQEVEDDPNGDADLLMKPWTRSVFQVATPEDYSLLKLPL